METNPVVEKTLPSITQAERVLLLQQPAHPEGGIQVAGGSVRANERAVEAALRSMVMD